ncbi:hypothetical protein M422DRAFT_242876 [Sphaerobolus stellatus SS14]|uniref:Uncharacterized protein n=1 Tax=Sphaerobolus stellatus (strain SS14) TaxID=990650 RepID=A0A0C9UGP9_SPHS4|nr:hypothetical protein M422DRAFT_264050 [Sphaerobolus stellatus SS14]KIJ52923.1 hypothetical protein M422DRAFT_242876 [Sphaerobolus stellatus SS14]
MHRPSWTHSRFAVEGAFVFTSHADFRAQARNVLLFQPAAANYRPPPPSQPRIFVPAVPFVVGRQVYNYHAIYESMPEGMEAAAIGPLWVEVLVSLQQVVAGSRSSRDRNG